MKKLDTPNKYKNYEVKILKKLDHPNIIKVYDCYETKNYEFIFMEYCEESLLTVLLDKGKFEERDLKSIIKQLLSALKYCHIRNIVHRDIKLENILLKKDKNSKKGWIVKLIDFGHSTIILPKKYMMRVCGSHFYIAPEVLQEHYNKKCDMWSLGVIIFCCLTSHFPFAHENLWEQFQIIISKEFKFNPYEKSVLSKSARNLIHKLLNRNIS
jgi:calcium-dependent protein kinase